MAPPALSLSKDVWRSQALSSYFISRFVNWVQYKNIESRTLDFATGHSSHMGHKSRVSCVAGCGFAYGFVIYVTYVFAIYSMYGFLIYVPSHPRTLPVREQERHVREHFVPFASWFPFANGKDFCEHAKYLHGYG